MHVHNASAPHDVARAAAIDQALLGSDVRSGYIGAVAARGGLSVAKLNGDVEGFCCVDHQYFFGKPFVALLVVSQAARRNGVGSGLLAFVSRSFPEIWTSTNRSNEAMRKLLIKAGWRYCGELSGLDEGDPELFYKAS